MLKEANNLNEKGIAIMGMGYVGLTLSAVLAKNGFKVYGTDVKDIKIFIVRFAFKGEPETSDMRDSTPLWFFDELKKYASNIYSFDPVIDNEQLKHLGIKVYDTMEKGYSNADVILFVNNHKSYLNIDPFEICSKTSKPAIFYDALRMFEKELFDDLEGVCCMRVEL